VAESPESPNLRTIVWDTTCVLPAGNRVETRMSSGIRAVNACEASTRERSIPFIVRKRRTHPPRNDSPTRWLSAAKSSVGSSTDPRFLSSLGFLTTLLTQRTAGIVRGG
jgi:hypothetical protein